MEHDINDFSHKLQELRLPPTFNVIPLTLDNCFSTIESVCACSTKINELIRALNRQSITICEFMKAIELEQKTFETNLVNTINEWKTTLLAELEAWKTTTVTYLTNYINTQFAQYAEEWNRLVAEEKENRINGDTFLQQAINNEINNRASDNSQLQANINAESNARQNADNTLQTNITNEATTRLQQDTILQNELTALSKTIGGISNVNDLGVVEHGDLQVHPLLGTLYAMETNAGVYNYPYLYTEGSYFITCGSLGVNEIYFIFDNICDYSNALDSISNKLEAQYAVDYDVTVGFTDKKPTTTALYNDADFTNVITTNHVTSSGEVTLIVLNTGHNNFKGYPFIKVFTATASTNNNIKSVSNSIQNHITKATLVNTNPTGRKNYILEDILEMDIKTIHPIDQGIGFCYEDIALTSVLDANFLPYAEIDILSTNYTAETASIQPFAVQPVIYISGGISYLRCNLSIPTTYSGNPAIKIRYKIKYALDNLTIT